MPAGYSFPHTSPEHLDRIIKRLNELGYKTRKHWAEEKEIERIIQHNYCVCTCKGNDIGWNTQPTTTYPIGSEYDLFNTDKYRCGPSVLTNKSESAVNVQFETYGSRLLCLAIIDRLTELGNINKTILDNNIITLQNGVIYSSDSSTLPYATLDTLFKTDTFKRVNEVKISLTEKYHAIITNKEMVSIFDGSSLKATLSIEKLQNLLKVIGTGFNGEATFPTYGSEYLRDAIVSRLIKLGWKTRSYHENICKAALTGAIAIGIFDKSTIGNNQNQYEGDMKLLFSSEYYKAPTHSFHFNGEYTAEIKGNTLKVGCATFTKEHVQKVLDAAK